MRTKFYRWLVLEVFKTQEGAQLPRILVVIYAILFPIHYMLGIANGVKYDIRSDTYTIEWAVITAEFFREMGRSEKTRIFKVNEDGISIKMLDDLQPNQDK